MMQGFAAYKNYVGKVNHKRRTFSPSVCLKHLCCPWRLALGLAVGFLLQHSTEYEIHM